MKMSPAPHSSSSSTVAPADRWAWHRRTLRALHRRLTAGAEAHRREADALLVDAPGDRPDRVAEDNEIETLLAEAGGELRLRAEVEAALARIEAGTYGRCEDSGAPIPEARLRAVPWTRYTREVAERRERGDSR